MAGPAGRVAAQTVTGQESLTYDSWFDPFWLTCPSLPDSGTIKVNQIYSCEMANLYVWLWILGCMHSTRPWLEACSLDSSQA